MNMKRLLTLAAFFATLQASAQQVNPVPDYVFANRMSAGRNTVTDTAAYFSIGPRYGATRGMMPPMVVDTASFSANKRNGLLIFSVQKNKFLYWDSVGVKWAEMAGTGGSAIAGTGTTNYIPKFTGTTTIGNSQIFDDGTTVGVNTITPVSHYKLDVDGRIRARTQNGGVVVGFPSDSSRSFSAIGTNFQSNTWLEQYGNLDGPDLILIRGRGTPNAKANAQVGDRLGGIDYRSYVNGQIRGSATISADITRVDSPNNVSESDIVIEQIFNNSLRENARFKTWNRGFYVRGNMSVGDTSATEMLDVYGRTRVRTIDSTSSPINVLSSDANGVIRKTSFEAVGVQGSGTTNYISKFTATKTVGDSQIFDNGTNVGVSTASPSFKLDVNGSFRAQASEFVATFQGTDPAISLKSGTYEYYAQVIATVNRFRIVDRTANIERISLTSAGDVGIGQASPSYKLDVNGTLRSSNGAFFATSSGEVSIGTTTDAGDYKLQVAGNIYNTGSITTGAPSGGSIKPWKIGEAATVSPTSPNRTLRVEVDGVVYYIHAKTTND